MAYMTSSDLTSHMSVATQAQLSNDTANAATIDSTVITGLIGHATSVIDATLKKAFIPVPLNPVPDIINTIAVDIVIFLLWARKVESQAIPPSVQAEYDGAMKMLQDIADLKIPLGS